MSSKLPIVFRSLSQILRTLSVPEVAGKPEVKNLLKACASGPHAILEPNSMNPILPNHEVSSPSKQRRPFVVVEGLDGSGKTLVSTCIAEKTGLELMSTPPPEIKSFKTFFDEQEETLRRAFYSLGNYVAAQKIEGYSASGVIMDRYWHSTAAYAIAHELTNRLKKSYIPKSFTDEDFIWPSDLLKPDLVIFLVVSEDLRRYRHAYRQTTNTKEEQMLAASGEMRKNLIHSYQSIKGPEFIQVDANDDIEIVKTKVSDLVMKSFPHSFQQFHAGKKNIEA